MADFFRRLSEQVLERATVVQPLRAVRFARLPDMHLPGPTALRQPLSAPTDDGPSGDSSGATFALVANRLPKPLVSSAGPATSWPIPSFHQLGRSMAPSGDAMLPQPLPPVTPARQADLAELEEATTPTLLVRSEESLDPPAQSELAPTTAGRATDQLSVGAVDPPLSATDQVSKRAPTAPVTVAPVQPASTELVHRESAVELAVPALGEHVSVPAFDAPNPSATAVAPEPQVNLLAQESAVAPILPAEHAPILPRFAEPAPTQPTRHPNETTTLTAVTPLAVGGAPTVQMAPMQDIAQPAATPITADRSHLAEPQVTPVSGERAMVRTPLAEPEFRSETGAALPDQPGNETSSAPNWGEISADAAPALQRAPLSAGTPAVAPAPLTDAGRGSERQVMPRSPSPAVSMNISQANERQPTPVMAASRDRTGLLPARAPTEVVLEALGETILPVNRQEAIDMPAGQTSEPAFRHPPAIPTTALPTSEPIAKATTLKVDRDVVEAAVRPASLLASMSDEARPGSESAGKDATKSEDGEGNPQSLFLLDPIRKPVVEQRNFSEQPGASPRFSDRQLGEARPLAPLTESVSATMINPVSPSPEPAAQTLVLPQAQEAAPGFQALFAPAPAPVETGAGPQSDRVNHLQPLAPSPPVNELRPLIQPLSNPQMVNSEEKGNGEKKGNGEEKGNEVQAERRAYLRLAVAPLLPVEAGGQPIDLPSAPDANTGAPSRFHPRRAGFTPHSPGQQQVDPAPALTIRVTIGRVEVRHAAEPPAGPTRRRAAQPAMSLDTYLARTQQGRV